MCQGSRHAAKFEDAGEGDALGIGKMKVGRKKIGAFHRLGETTAQCVMCVQSGAKLTLGQIPWSLQKRFGIGATAVVTFQEGGWHEDDRLLLENGRHVRLKLFADKNVGVFVGIKTDVQPDKELRAQDGPAMRTHTGVLATLGDGNRAIA